MFYFTLSFLSFVAFWSLCSIALGATLAIIGTVSTKDWKECAKMVVFFCMSSIGAYLFSKTFTFYFGKLISSL